MRFYQNKKSELVTGTFPGESEAAPELSQLAGTQSLVTQSRPRRTGSINVLVIVGLVVIALAGGCWLAFQNSPGPAGPEADRRSGTDPTEPSSPVEGFPVSIRKPSGPPRVDTGVTDIRGNVVTVSCSTCHATRDPNPENRSVTDLDEFHGSLALAHGTVSCLSCHNPEDYDALKLADGSRIEFTDVMTLCAQCHGPQMRDYEHGAHGGMNGYWDLTRGPRTKNNCVDCHNPHVPQFPKMQPTFKPRDRFLEKIEEH